MGTGPFDGFIEKLTNLLTPHIVSAGEQIAQGIQSITGRLDMLNESVLSREFIEIRKTVRLQLTADTQRPLLHARAGEEWELEFVTVLGACSITITESDLFRLAIQFDTADVSQGIGMIVRENSQLEIVATGNVTPVAVSMQFKRRHRDYSRGTKATGYRDPALEFSDRKGVDDPGRHGSMDGVDVRPTPTRT